jgi:peptidoglycan/LPS O-acetylase OafA/YrhL
MNPSPADGRSGRLAELDGLRGVAVLMVLAYHYTTRFGELFPDLAWGQFPWGLYGPHLFFVISGFVIVMTLDRSERPMDFLVGRFSRLYPAYWTALLLTSLVLWLARGLLEPPSAGRIAANLSMVHGFFGVASVDGVYWTLEVELLFYALALAVFWAGMLPRAHLAIAGWLALSALFYSPLWAAHLEHLPFAAKLARLLVLEYVPFFATGILFYRRYKGQGSALADYALLAFAALLILLHWPLSVSVIIAGGALVLSKLRGGMAALRFRPLVFVGTISYSLYLLHQKIGQVVLLSLAQHGFGPVARIAAATALAIALASAITFLVERPAMRAIRRRYEARRARQRPAAAPWAAAR